MTGAASTGSADGALAELLLSLADDELVIGYWDSEWTGVAPMLEEDVAMSSVSQDEVGHARALYGLLGELMGRDPDEIAYHRDADAFRHAALLNHARDDWAFTIARRYLYETADSVRLEALARSSHRPLAELAAKMRREERYHLMHVDAWMRRLAGGPARERLGVALERAWPDAQAIFSPLAGERSLLAAGTLPEPLEALRERWVSRVRAFCDGIGLSLDPAPPAPPDGRRVRTDEFRWLHGEMTMVAGSGAGSAW